MAIEHISYTNFVFVHDLLLYHFSCVFLVHSSECMTDLDSLTQYIREQEEEQDRLQRGSICDVLQRFRI